MLCSEFNSLTQTQHRLGANKVYTGRLKKSAIWKCDTFCFINQLSNDFQQRNIIACKHLAHCSYFEYKTVSDNQVLTEICQTFSSGMMACVLMDQILFV